MTWLDTCDAYPFLGVYWPVGLCRFAAAWWLYLWAHTLL